MTTRPSMLLITGWAHGRDAMQPLADRLADDFSVTVMTGAEVLALQDIPDTDCIITGSMGGILAIEHLPARCRKLVLLSSTARFCSDSNYPCGTASRVVQRMILQMKRNPSAVLTEFYQNVHHPNECPVQNVSDIVEIQSTDELIAGLEYLLHTDVRSMVPDIHIPVLLLHGSEDRIIPPAASVWLHKHLPESQYKTFEGAGHALLAHHFDEALKEIKRFLQN